MTSDSDYDYQQHRLGAVGFAHKVPAAHKVGRLHIKSPYPLPYSDLSTP
jgi:hypothetical protein